MKSLQKKNEKNFIYLRKTINYVISSNEILLKKCISYPILVKFNNSVIIYEQI